MTNVLLANVYAFQRNFFIMLFVMLNVYRFDNETMSQATQVFTGVFECKIKLTHALINIRKVNIFQKKKCNIA